MAPKSKTSSVLSVLESSNDPIGVRRNSFASAGTNASNPASRSGSFASVGTNASHPGRHNSFSSATQANLVTQRANAPTNIWTQQRPNVLENVKANIAAKLAQEKQEKAEEKARRNRQMRQNRVATMKRRGRAPNYGTLIGLPHRNNVSASSPVENVAMSYPVPLGNALSYPVHPFPNNNVHASPPLGNAAMVYPVTTYLNNKRTRRNSRRSRR